MDGRQLAVGAALTLFGIGATAFVPIIGRYRWGPILLGVLGFSCILSGAGILLWLLIGWLWPLIGRRFWWTLLWIAAGIALVYPYWSVFSRLRRAALDRSVPWRQAETVLGRYDELAVNFDAPSRYDLGSYRPDHRWNEKYERFEADLGRLELATEGAPMPWYEDYRGACAAIRDVLSAPAPEPRGKSHYLRLSESGVIDRLRELTRRARAAAGVRPKAPAGPLLPKSGS